MNLLNDLRVKHQSLDFIENIHRFEDLMKIMNIKADFFTFSGLALLDLDKSLKNVEVGDLPVP